MTIIEALIQAQRVIEEAASHGSSLLTDKARTHTIKPDDDIITDLIAISGIDMLLDEAVELWLTRETA